MRRASDTVSAPGRKPPVTSPAPSASQPAAPSRADAMIAALSGVRDKAPLRAAQAFAQEARALPGATCAAYLSLGSNIDPERNLRMAVAALRARFGELQVSPVYRTRAVGFDGPDFLNAIVVVQSDLNPFALHRWLHRLEEAQGRDRRDASYSNRPLDVDIIYFGDFVLDGPGDFQLPRPELQHAFVLKPLADIAPDFVDPIRNVTLAQLWAIHPDHDTPPPQAALAL
jgi:2-amino-4-hydroxy-6-hydroxymethyldihydropteridine diphosphokinase